MIGWTALVAFILATCVTFARNKPVLRLLSLTTAGIDNFDYGEILRTNALTFKLKE